MQHAQKLMFDEQPSPKLLARQLLELSSRSGRNDSVVTCAMHLQDMETYLPATMLPEHDSLSAGIIYVLGKIKQTNKINPLDEGFVEKLPVCLRHYRKAVDELHADAIYRSFAPFENPTGDLENLTAEQQKACFANEAEHFRRTLDWIDNAMPYAQQLAEYCSKKQGSRFHL